MHASVKIPYPTFSNSFDGIGIHQTGHLLPRGTLPCFCPLELLQRAREKLPDEDQQMNRSATKEHSLRDLVAELLVAKEIS